jgi:glycosyltransferase involved in cell wall biosynthesis
MDSADLTIVLPTRNEATNIHAFLASLPETLRLIVVDASTDETPELIRAGRPALTTVLRHPGNVAEARQAGAEAARTPWLLFTDADVIFPTRYFERLLRHTGCDALYGAKLSRDAYGWYYRAFTRGQQVAHALGIAAVSGSNLLVNAAAFQAVGGFDCELSCNEDSELGWRLQRRGFRVRYDSQLAVFARDHRRLRRGVIAKTVHSLTRCSLLYLGLLPERWRRQDWGYWAPPRKRSIPDGTES